MRKLRIFLAILIVIGLALLFTQKFWVPKVTDFILSFQDAKTEKTVSTKPAGDTAPKISITSKDIKEENFSGTMPVISGSSPLAVKMREYVVAQVAEFRKQANIDVPDMRENFGEDSPTANYTIDISSKYIKGDKTESIATSVYTYTGGAHGSSFYKVITASRSSGKILLLSDMVKKEGQKSFTEFVKKELNKSFGENVFPEEVKNLTFTSFSNWSLDYKNFTIYFDQYAIGPSALGPVAFPLSLEKIKNFLQ